MIVLIALSLTLLCVCSVEASYEQRINYYLLDHCDQPDLNSNIAKAKEFLAETENKPATNYNEALKKDLEVFISLEAIENNADLCNGKSVAILEANNQLVGGVKTKANKEKLTRLESLVYQALLKHSTHCESVYAQNYDKAVKELDVSKIKLAQEVTSDLASGRKTSTASWEFLVNQGKWGHQGLVRAVQQSNDDRIEFVSAHFDETTGENTINREKLLSLYKDYILTPCNYYVDNLGADILEPASFDSALKPSQLSTELDTYRECKLITNEHYSKSLFENIIKFMLLPKPQTSS